jgi:hypothetical protein
LSCHQGPRHLVSEMFTGHSVFKAG